MAPDSDSDGQQDRITGSAATFRQKGPDECLRDLARCAWDLTSLGSRYLDDGGTYEGFVDAFQVAAASAGVIVVQAR